ncbi:MAG: hypothetical protein ACFFEK_04335 [Candidatus Thorarchaeota archaeon]
MFEESFEVVKSDRACSSYHLAVSIGLVGIVAQLVLYFIGVGLYMNLIDDLLSMQEWSILNYVLSGGRFISSLMIALGFVGIFGMKGSKLGIVFPLSSIFIYYGFWQFQIVLYQLGISSTELLIGYNRIVGLLFAVIGGLVLLTIRKKSVKPLFIIFFTIFYMTQGTFSILVFYLILGYSVPIETGLEYLITQIPGIAFFVLTACFTMVLFWIEKRAGCTEMILPSSPQV